MPLTKKGAKIEHAMSSEYGSKKGKRIFYASINAGKLHGVEGKPHHPAGEGQSHHILKEPHGFKGHTARNDRN